MNLGMNHDTSMLLVYEYSTLLSHTYDLRMDHIMFLVCYLYITSLDVQLYTKYHLYN